MKALVGRRSWSQNFVRRHFGLHYNRAFISMSSVGLHLFSFICLQSHGSIDRSTLIFLNEK